MDNYTLRDSNPGTVFPVPGVRIGEFLIREYSFALSLIANCDLCVVTMVTQTSGCSGRTDLGEAYAVRRICPL